MVVWSCGGVAAKWWWRGVVAWWCRRVVVVVMVWNVLPIRLPPYLLNEYCRGVGGDAVRGGVVAL